MEYEERRARITKKENERAEQEKRDVASVRRGYKDEADEIEWRRNIEAIAQEWMLDSAAKATLREMGETARAMNKRQKALISSRRDREEVSSSLSPLRP